MNKAWKVFEKIRSGHEILVINDLDMLGPERLFETQMIFGISLRISQLRCRKRNPFWFLPLVRWVNKNIPNIASVENSSVSAVSSWRFWCQKLPYLGVFGHLEVQDSQQEVFERLRSSERIEVLPFHFSYLSNRSLPFQFSPNGP